MGNNKHTHIYIYIYIYIWKPKKEIRFMTKILNIDAIDMKGADKSLNRPTPQCRRM